VREESEGPRACVKRGAEADRAAPCERTPDKRWDKAAEGVRRGGNRGKKGGKTKIDDGRKPPAENAYTQNRTMTYMMTARRLPADSKTRASGAM
jgi:hypothetical protein